MSEPQNAPMSTFLLNNLSVLNYANGHTHWYYKIQGNLLSVLSHDFFSAAQDMLTPGDIIQASNADGAVFLHVGTRGISVMSMTP